VSPRQQPFPLLRSDPDDRDIVVECRDQILSLKSDVAKQQERSSSCYEDSSRDSSNDAMQSQVDTMLQILRQLQAQIPSQKTNDQPAGVKIIDGGLEAEKKGDDGVKESSACTQLIESINELCLLIGDKEQTIKADDANDIVEKLQKLIEYAKSEQLQPIRGAGNTEDSDKGELSRDLGRLSRHLISSTRLSINEGGELKIFISHKMMKSDLKEVQKASHAGIALWQDRQQKQFNVGAGHLTITTTKRKYQLMESNGRTYKDNSDKKRKADAEDFLAKLIFFPPRGSAQGRMFEMSIYQRELTKELILTIPNISVNRVRPGYSQVFRLVKEGDLNGLRKSLAEGKASVRDHDEDGRSLLFVSGSQ